MGRGGGDSTLCWSLSSPLTQPMASLWWSFRPPPPTCLYALHSVPPQSQTHAHPPTCPYVSHACTRAGGNAWQTQMAKLPLPLAPAAAATMPLAYHALLQLPWEGPLKYVGGRGGRAGEGRRAGYLAL